MNNRHIFPLVSALLLALAGSHASAQESALDALIAPPPVATPVPAAQPVADAPVAVEENVVFQPVPFHPMPSPLQIGDEDIRTDDLVRDIARYRTRESRLDAMSSLEAAHLERERARIQAYMELLEQQSLLVSGGPSTEEEVGAGEESQVEKAAVQEYIPPTPVVRSIYGHGENTFAEIYIGSTKVVATPGTILATGERVVEITSSGVVVVKGGRRQVLQVAGSAGVNPPPAAPVSR